MLEWIDAPTSDRADGYGDALTPASTLSTTKDPDNPTFAFNAIPENIVKVDDTYWCVYQGSWGGPVWDVRLAYATSRDGPWTEYASNPIYEFSDVAWAPGTSNNIYAPEIIEHDGTFYLFYSIVNSNTGADGYIGLATADAVTGPYTDHGAAILSPGTAGAWDSLRVSEPSPLYHDGRWLLSYMGEDTDFAFGASEQIGMAYADAPEGPYTKAPANPLIPLGDAGTWDDNLVADPILKFTNGYYWIMYAGNSGGATPSHSSGMAYALDPVNGPWTKHPDNPVLDHGGSGDFDERGAWRGGLLLEDGLWSGVYGGYNSDQTVVRGGNYRLNVATPVASDDDETAPATVPLANGDSSSPAYLFLPDGTGLFVEATL